MLSYWYDIIIKDINHHPLSSSWYSRHHQANHHFINRSKGGLLSNLLGACTETSAPDFVCHQKLLTAEIQDQERTKDPNKMGFLKDLGCIDKPLLFFPHKKTMGRVVVIWFNGSIWLNKISLSLQETTTQNGPWSNPFCNDAHAISGRMLFVKKSFTSLDLV